MEQSPTYTLFAQDDSALSISEKEQLARLEETVERGLKTFVDVGTALMVVRDSKLYRQTHATFESYCRERWKLGKSRVYEMIDAAGVVQNLKKSEISDFLPNEAQARALSALPSEQQPEVWQQAVDSAPNGKVTAAHVQRVADEYDEQAEELSGDEEAYDWTETAPTKPHVTHNSGNNEWNTPSTYIEAARAVMGAIDLDPASSDAANEVVQAATYYTIDDDGLVQEWRGRVFMNPPYASGLVDKFADKLARHVGAGDVSEAIVLVNNATETQWFQTLAGCASAICFPKRRIRFVGAAESGPLQGQAFIYVGKNDIRFVAEFGRFGFSVAVL